MEARELLKKILAKGAISVEWKPGSMGGEVYYLKFGCKPNNIQLTLEENVVVEALSNEIVEERVKAKEEGKGRREIYGRE